MYKRFTTPLSLHNRSRHRERRRTRRAIMPQKPSPPLSTWGSLKEESPRPLPLLFHLSSPSPLHTRLHFLTSFFLLSNPSRSPEHVPASPPRTCNGSENSEVRGAGCETLRRTGNGASSVPDDPVARTLGTWKGASPVYEIPKVLATQPANNAADAVYRPLRRRHAYGAAEPR